MRHASGAAGRGTDADGPGPAADRTVVAFPGRSAAQRRARRWAAAAGVLAVTLATIWALFFSPLLAVDSVRVEGAALVDRAEVERRLEPLRGTPLPRVRGSQVSDLLDGVPGLASASAAAEPPTGVVVALEERRVVAVRRGEGGQVVLLEDGSLVDGVPAERVAAALGQRSAPTMAAGLAEADAPRREEAAQVLLSLPEDLGARMTDVAAPAPQSVVLTTDEGVEVVWGDASHVERKAAVVRALLDPAEAGGDRPRMSRLDVSVPERPITR